jgi:RNA polymerase sigma-70 factor (ECF subfamily)
MVQESFQRLWRSAGRFDARRGNVAAYLFAIARSAAADIRKRPSSRPLLQAEDAQLPPLPDNAEQILNSLILREALDKLSSAHAEVLRLILEENLTQAEIGNRLGLAIGTVKSRTFNGMRALRSVLGERGIHAA